MQCPICKFHAEHIFTIEISPKTHQRWRVERCPNCNHAFDLELQRDYESRHKLDIENQRRIVRPDDPESKWRFGL
jgi:transposase-like protein